MAPPQVRSGSTASGTITLPSTSTTALTDGLGEMTLSEDTAESYVQPPQPVNFARVGQKADLKIKIGEFTAMVVSSVVCYFSPVLRFMCTQHLEPAGTPPDALAFPLDHFKYIPASHDGVDADVAVLNIESEEVWADPDDEGEILSLVLHAMHGNGTKVPIQAMQCEITAVAVFSGAYSCTEVMLPWFRIWFDHYDTIYRCLSSPATLVSRPTTLDWNLRAGWVGDFITVSFVIKDPVALECLLKLSVLEDWDDYISVLNDKMYPSIAKVFERFQDIILAAQAKIKNEITSVLKHIYDVYVGNPTPTTSNYINMETASLGSCRYTELGRFLCALQKRLPFTGFLLDNLAKPSLNEVFIGLFQAAGDIDQQRKTDIKKNPEYCANCNPSRKQTACPNPATQLADALKRIQESIQIPVEEIFQMDCISDIVPMTPLIVPSPRTRRALKNNERLYSKHVSNLLSCDEYGWNYFYVQQWLSKVIENEE